MSLTKENIVQRKQIEVGERIRRKRMELDLTQTAFSQLLDISPSYLSAIERGQRNLSSNLCHTIHEITGMSYDYIMTGEYEKDLAYARYVCEPDDTVENPDAQKRIKIMLDTCNNSELSICYEICHSYLSNSRRAALLST